MEMWYNQAGSDKSCLCAEPLVTVYTGPHIRVGYANGNRRQFVLLPLLSGTHRRTLSTSDEPIALGRFSREEIEHMAVSVLRRQRVDDAFFARGAAFVRDGSCRRWRARASYEWSTAQTSATW